MLNIVKYVVLESQTKNGVFLATLTWNYVPLTIRSLLTGQEYKFPGSYSCRDATQKEVAEAFAKRLMKNSK